MPLKYIVHLSNHLGHLKLVSSTVCSCTNDDSFPVVFTVALSLIATSPSCKPLFPGCSFHPPRYSIRQSQVIASSCCSTVLLQQTKPSSYIILYHHRGLLPPTTIRLPLGFSCVSPVQ